MLTWSLFASASAATEKITVAAAANLKSVMDEISASFRKNHPGREVDVVYGASGKLQAQIRQGAPIDLFFSADMVYPQSLADSGFAASPPKAYAIGRLVLWSNTRDASKLTLESLSAPEIRRISMANPKHAPYGKRAEEVLRASGLWDKVESKLVYGESLSQAAQFVQTKNAQVGIIALSMASSPELAPKGGHFLIPDSLHQILDQGFIITKRAEGNGLAKAFADNMAGEHSRSILEKSGYALPDRQAQ